MNQKIIIALAVLLVLFAAVSAVIMWAIYWARYPFAVKRRREKKTCDTCENQPECDRFFLEQYRGLGMEEPEFLKNAGCKMHKTKGR